MRESIEGGGRVVKLWSGSVGVEDVPDAAPGRVVRSVHVVRDGDHYTQACYRLTKRVHAGGSLWHARRLDSAIVGPA